MTTVFVAAHDGGCEGYSAPFQAFTCKEDALMFVKHASAVGSESYQVFEVPVWPTLQETAWYNLKPIS